jgi:hypothetical protein
VTPGRIGLVVEGYGDRDAVPVVVRNYLHAHGEFEVKVGKPLNAKGRGNLLKAGQLEKFVGVAASEPGTSGVLVVLDAEDDAACELAPELLARAESAAAPKPARVSVAVRKFENWLAASDLQEPYWAPGALGYEGTGADAAIRRWLPTSVYSKTAMQAGLASGIDFDLVRQRCPSFARLLVRIDELRRLARPICA